MKIAIALLVLASLLLLFGCAGKGAQPPSQGAVQQAEEDSQGGLSDADLAVMGEADSEVPLEEMPLAGEG